jgi:hypothetical protein
MDLAPPPGTAAPGRRPGPGAGLNRRRRRSTSPGRTACWPGGRRPAGAPDGDPGRAPRPRCRSPCGAESAVESMSRRIDGGGRRAAGWWRPTAVCPLAATALPDDVSGARWWPRLTTRPGLTRGRRGARRRPRRGTAGAAALQADICGWAVGRPPHDPLAPRACGGLGRPRPEQPILAGTPCALEGDRPAAGN